MSTKYTRDSSADIWTHLNTLDDQGVRWFATVAARNAAIPAPAAGMRVVIGSGTSMVEQVHDGTDWTVTYQPPQGFTPVVTASSGAFTTITASCRWNRAGRLITANFSVTITAAGTATGNLIATLPVDAKGAVQEHGIGREIAATGAALVASISSNVCSVIGYDNASRIASGRTYRWTITYEAAA